MKNYYLLLLAWCGLPLLAQSATNNDPQPEKIYSITMVNESLDYYLQQAELWKKETEKNPKNGDAWYNYYLAARYANMRTDEEPKPYSKKDILTAVKKAIPGSFEDYYLTFRESEWEDRTRWDNLLKAFEMKPERVELYHDLMTYYELEGDDEKMREACQKWFDSGNYSPGMMQWNYNVLMSLEENAVLLTVGDNDTYPIWLLQYAKEVRPDVGVINIHLLKGIEDYRTAILKKNGLSPFTKKAADYEDDMDFTNDLLAHVFQQESRPVYININGLHNFGKAFKDNLYMTGLALKYSEAAIDNVAILKNNFENKFLKDYLTIDIYNDKSKGVVDHANLNYIAPFTVLYKHYKASGERIKADSVKTLTMIIAKRGGKEADLQEFFEQYSKPYKRINSVIPLKSLEKNKVKIRGNLWAAATEVTNEEYELFLMDLVKNRTYDLLEKCQIHSTDWYALLPEAYRNLPEADVFIHGHPEQAEVPVKNISHEAALAYCEWITNVYNNSTDKKKKHKTVIFRLPTAEEWEFAAKAGKDVHIYPWDYREMGAKPVNLKGCYVANFNVSEEPPCEDCPAPTAATSKDGGFFAVKADAYFPNDLGLYNTIGNVAEMIQQKGIAKGGSWEDKPDACTITSTKSYENPSPAIGFRVFMEVIN